MAGMSDYLEQEFLKHLLRTGSWTKPTAIWVALHTADPADTGAGAEVTTAGSTNYGRVQHGPADDKWSEPAEDGESSNVGTVTFPAPGADAWGAITHFALWDAETGGNMLSRGALGTPKTVNANDPAPSFAEGALVARAA